MTDFVGCYLTKAGLELSAKSGVDIIFTRAETGSGVYISPEGVRELTSLKDKRCDYQLEDVEVKGELADIVFYVTNKGVTEAYKLTEVGVYAKDENSEEILYCVAFAYEDNAETIDAEAAGQITYCQKFCVETKVSADANVSVQITGTDHEWVKNYFIKYAGEVNLEEGTLQEQISNHTHGSMVGATSDHNGKSGMVPEPEAGQEKMALFGDAKFRRVEDEIDTTYNEPEKLERLESGEKFKNMLGKIAKAVSTVFGKLDKTSVVNNNTTTESGFALDARQANPTIEGTMAASIAQLNNDLLNLAHEYWSGIHFMEVSNTNEWVRGDANITLPAGSYVMIFKVLTTCLNSIYIDTKVDTAEGDFFLFEKTQNLPPSCSLDASPLNRTMNVPLIFTITEPLQFYFWAYASSKIKITYEFEAVCIKEL